MPPPSRFASPEDAGSRSGAGAFCGVVKDERGGNHRHFVVRTEAPRLVVEFEAPAPAGATAAGGAVIRRVCVPNSWAGDYHQPARLLGAAVAYFESSVERTS